MTREQALTLLNAWAADFKVGIIPESTVVAVVKALTDDPRLETKMLEAWFIELDN